MISSIASLLNKNSLDASDEDVENLSNNISECIKKIIIDYLSNPSRRIEDETVINTSLDELSMTTSYNSYNIQRPQQNYPYLDSVTVFGLPWGNFCIQTGQYYFDDLSNNTICGLLRDQSTTAGYCKITLPIAYTTNFQVITCDSGQACYRTGCKQIDNTSFYMYCQVEPHRTPYPNDPVQADATLYSGIIRWVTFGYI